MICNKGKTAKASIRKITKVVEEELVFPLIRGKSLKKWYANSDGFIILPVNTKSGEILSEKEVKIHFPKTYEYFLEFVNELKSRSGYKQLLIKAKKPFYAVLRAKYGITPYKVAWKHISGKISGKANLECAVIGRVNEKPIVPSHGLVIINFNNEEEAYYVSSILNSSFAQYIVASYGLEVHITTDVPKKVYIPKFDPENKLHLKLSELSKKAHEIARKIYEEKREDLKLELNLIEEEIDKTVAQLYGIDNKELKEIKETLRILKGDIKEK